MITNYLAIGLRKSSVPTENRLTPPYLGEEEKNEEEHSSERAPFAPLCGKPKE